MKTATPAKSPSRNRWSIPVLLAAVLVLLFWRSFLPGYVHFSNDGPLGVQHSDWLKLPQAITGQWYDLNSIGSNAGESALDITTLVRWILQPVGYAKFYAPVALWILGLSAWFCFRQMKLTRLAAALGGLAAMLVSTSFSDACWGVASHEIAIGMDFCALGLALGNLGETSTLKRSLRLALAGLAVGMNVVEAADIGAILSMFVALFVFFQSLTEETGAAPIKVARGFGRVVIIAVFAGFIAAQAVSSLIGTSISGIGGVSGKAEDKQVNWDNATQWSLPKKETLGLFVPGLFGYRMDTPKDMLPALQDDYKGGNYWGGIGRTPAIDRYFDSGGKDSPPPGTMRFSGTGEYEGILVMLIAIWAITQSFRRQGNAFTLPQRKFIWLGLAILIFSLLMAWGRFAPAFYGAFYQLPYASSIRNPAKFLIVFNFATVILFALGVHGLSRLYLQPSGVPAALGSWWARVRGFDRRWTIGSVAALLLSLVAWLAYISNESKLVAYLKRRGFPDDQFARDIAAFSVGQAGWFLLFFALSVGLVILVVAGVFSGRRARLGGILLGALLIVDLGRANLPWIIHWDYKQKYEIGALNPIAKFLAQKPYEHRVAALPFNTPEGYEIFSGPGGLYSIEWLQHLFPYYNIPTLDKIQMPREPIDLEAFERSLIPHTMADVSLFTRFWQLTATRYLLGPAGYIDLLNSQIDPQQHRFRIAQRFNIVLKPGVEQFHQRLEELTAVVDDNGPFALFEFTGALPRVKLYTHWETNSAADVKNFSTNGLDDNQLYVFNEAGTNGFLTLQKLASPSFDAGKTVLLDAPLPEGNPAGATNANSGTVDFESYAPRDIKLKANAVAPSVLLLNDKFDPNWTVTVDGRPSTIFHANFIMRGVFLNPGEHVVEFRFNLPNGPLYVTIAGVAVTLLIIVVLIFLRNRAESPAQR